MPRSTSRPCWCPTSARTRATSRPIPETRSELCIPLIYKDKVIGVLDIEHTRRGYFNEDHVRIMTTMAAQVAIAIENATLYERIARQEKRLEQDLALARELQFRLLPQKLPIFKNAEVATRFAPARQIGGDLYDFLKYSAARALPALRWATSAARARPPPFMPRWSVGIAALARHGGAERSRDAGGSQPVAGGAPHRRAVRLDDLRHLGRSTSARCSWPTPACRVPCIAATGKVDEIKSPACPSDCSPTRPTKR